jgi:hypothetical protein
MGIGHAQGFLISLTLGCGGPSHKPPDGGDAGVEDVVIADGSIADGSIADASDSETSDAGGDDTAPGGCLNGWTLHLTGTPAHV